MSVLDAPAALPRPTTDRERAFADLERHGYCVVADALTGPQVDALRRRVVDQALGEDAVGQGFHDGEANQRLWMLPNKGRIFRDLALHPLVEEFMGRLLGGPRFLLSSLTANIARPGGAPMYLHRDQGYVDFWTPKPLVANIAWMLDDFTDENGGTRLVPGSHLEPHGQFGPQDTVAAEGPAGAALVFDGRLFHGTGANRTAGEHRHAILAYHCRPFIRQQENFFLGLDPAVRAAERPEFLARLGYAIWAGLGRTDRPDHSGLLEHAVSPTGPLDAAGRPLPDA